MAVVACCWPNMIQKMNRKEAFPESWEQFAEMIKSFEYAGVVDSQSV